MRPLLFTFENPGSDTLASVTTYAALMFAGAGFGIALAVWLARRRGLPGFDVFAAGVIAFGVGFIGARLAYLLLNGVPEDLPLKVLLVRSGGLVWYGGLVGGALGALAYLRGYRVPVLPVLDVAAPAIALGHAFGRLGCFTAGCCYGKIAISGGKVSALAVHFPPGALAPPYLPLHPVQLYEAAGLLLLSILLVGLHLGTASSAAWAKRPGWIFGVYLGGYALLRLVTESYRADDRGGFLLGLSAGQWTSIVALALLILLAALRIGRARRSGVLQSAPVKSTREILPEAKAD